MWSFRMVVKSLVMLLKHHHHYHHHLCHLHNSIIIKIIIIEASQGTFQLHSFIWLFSHYYIHFIILIYITYYIQLYWSDIQPYLLKIGINALRTKLYLSNLKTHFLPRRKHSASVIKTDKLMLYTEIIAVCSEIHVKHINAIWAERRISEC